MAKQHMATEYHACLHHSSLGANVPWKILGKHFSQSWENIDK